MKWLCRINGKLLAFPFFVAAYCILTNEAFPSFRDAEVPVNAYHALGMIVALTIPALYPQAVQRMFAKAFLRILFCVAVAVCVILCFVAILIDPQVLYSRTIAVFVGIIAAAIICMWIAVVTGIKGRTLLFSLPLMLLISIVLVAALLQLPEIFHKYAVFITAVCSAIPGLLLKGETKVCFVQIGISIGVVLGCFSHGLLLMIGLSLELQIVAFFFSLVLIILTLVTSILGLQQVNPAGKVSAPAKAIAQPDLPVPTVVSAAVPTLVPTPASAPVPTPNKENTFITLVMEKGLTARQAEIALLTAKGFSVPAIAEELVLSKKTVGNHQSHIYKTLKIHTKQELIRKYQHLKSLEP